MLLIVILIVLGVIAVGGVLLGWERYRPSRGGPNAAVRPTDEVFVDPETGLRMRVWFDPATGVREYRQD